MRRLFKTELHKQMTLDPKIVLVTFDMGYRMWDEVRDNYPKRFFNIGASEQAGMDIAIGMALSGKKVFVYTISSFYLRCAEAINLYLHHEQIPVRLVGSGVDDSYKHDGFSHNCTMAQKFMDLMNFKTYYPKTKSEVPSYLKLMLQSEKPSCIMLQR